ncbi:MAG: MBL fold metallo-hydrolase [Anaerolineales bacterium]|nr:MBL fold metallo-hydrolase [Anaerolineales bacterium]
MLEIMTFTLGPAATNAYLVADTENNEAVVIDPAWEGETILAAAEERGWRIGQMWYTHAHFDHFGGAAGVVKGCDPEPVVALHPEDLPLWQARGGAPLFGIRLDDPGPEPNIELAHGQELQLGRYRFEVRYAPGHTRGHVMFYCAEQAVLFSGDVIFQGAIGRSDLPGGNYQVLMDSIRQQVLTLPDETRVLSGHGFETTVGVERRQNPFVLHG